jgi:hypothetical protein
MSVSRVGRQAPTTSAGGDKLDLTRVTGFRQPVVM